MPIRIDIPEPGWSSPTEYARYLDRSVDVFDETAVLGSARHFAALLGNQSLMKSIVDVNEMRNFAGDDKGLERHVVQLARGTEKPFVISATIWAPKGALAFDANDEPCGAPLLLGGYLGSACAKVCHDANVSRCSPLEKGEIVFLRSHDTHTLCDAPVPSILLSLALTRPSR